MKNIHSLNLAGFVAGFGTALAFLTAFGLLILAREGFWSMILVVVGSILAGFTASNTLYSDFYQRPVYWGDGRHYYFSHMTSAWTTKRIGLVGLFFILPVWFVFWLVYTITFFVMLWTGNF